jgi:hypothetical protein
MVTHPVYDLILSNDPSGSVVIGTWIHSIVTAVGAFPLNTDYCTYTITPPSGNKWSSDKVTFGNSNRVEYVWQLKEKGSYLVEVWALDKDGGHVPTASIFKGDKMFLGLVSNDSAGEAISSQIIIVE